MLISTAKDNVHFTPIEVKNFNALASIICDQTNKAYSFSTYKDNYRTKKNFQSMRCLGLDIDNDKNGPQLSLEQAKIAFQDYKCMIATTRSHQKEKNGLVTDRFRVILFFEHDVTDANVFLRTWFHLKSMFPAMDPACKDESRYWFPSQEVVFIQKQGKFVEIPDVVIEPVKEGVDLSVLDASPGDRGKLAYKTMKFFCQGAAAGERNPALFQAAIDCREQGYDIEYVKVMVTRMIETTGNWGTPHLNKKDMEAIENAFTRDVKYDKRGDDSSDTGIPYNFIPIKDTLNDDSIKTEWLIDGFLSVGGLSLFAGHPKSGKSTITRQSAIAVAQGKDFIGRKVKQGTVFYLALEDQSSQVKEQMMFQKVKLTDPIYIHYGPVSMNLEKLKDIIFTNEVRYLIVDTMALFLNPDDMNSYDIINKLLKELRQVARDTGCHITMIHHQNKSKEGGTLSIMGSNAIHGAVDNAIIFEMAGKTRFISSSQRGGKPFTNARLEFNPDLQLYKLAKKQTDKGDDSDDF